ncbi:MAG TPA: alpha/beta fold hydrolase [Actinopolymorphaceae bacterium]|nr:alpha/beta fold hydrolase [Actinopolymorphaceae bacterium]
MDDSLAIDVGEVSLSYRVAGNPDAPPMVLLHGLTSDASSWDAVLPYLASRWRLYCPTLRGHGSSGWPGTYSFPVMKQDLLGFLDGLGLGRVTLVGHSMGGVVAYQFAEDHPDHVEALVLEETPPPLPQQRPVPERPPGELSYDWLARLALVGQVNRPDPTWWDRLTEITAPTLVVGGGPESPFSQEEMAAVAERIPTARMVSVPVGHGVHKTDPAEFASAVQEFLSRTAHVRTTQA